MPRNRRRPSIIAGVRLAGAPMPPLILEVWEDLYRTRELCLRWTLFRRDSMISASTRPVEAEMQVWMRLDHPDRLPALMMLRFSR